MKVNPNDLKNDLLSIFGATDDEVEMTEWLLVIKRVNEQDGCYVEMSNGEIKLITVYVYIRSIEIDFEEICTLLASGDTKRLVARVSEAYDELVAHASFDRTGKHISSASRARMNAFNK